MFEMGAPSGGQPHSILTRASSSSTSSSRSERPYARRAFVQARDEPRRESVLGRADRVTRRERGDRHVAERCVDELAGAPERFEVDACFAPDASERLGERLGRGPVERDRDRVDRAADRRGPSSRSLERGRERTARRRPGRRDRPAVRSRRGHVRRAHGHGLLERSCRVVDDDPRRRRAPRWPWPVRRARRTPRPARDCGRGRWPTSLPAACTASTASHEIRHVVQRVVHPKDVDAALGGARDEPADEVALERARADEEPAAESHAERVSSSERQARGSAPRGSRRLPRQASRSTRRRRPRGSRTPRCRARRRARAAFAFPT